jgi:hypothetical protein
MPTEDVGFGPGIPTPSWAAAPPAFPALPPPAPVPGPPLQEDPVAAETPSEPQAFGEDAVAEVQPEPPAPDPVPEPFIPDEGVAGWLRDVLLEHHHRLRQLGG